MSSPVPKEMKEHKILPKMEKKEVNREEGDQGMGGDGEAWVLGAEIPVTGR